MEDVVNTLIVANLLSGLAFVCVISYLFVRSRRRALLWILGGFLLSALVGPILVHLLVKPRLWTPGDLTAYWHWRNTITFSTETARNVCYSIGLLLLGSMLIGRAQSSTNNDAAHGGQ